jgi:phosphomannomutase
VARKNLAQVWISPVGEANVLAEMRLRKAVIGGEGNGGVIVPSINPCRDSFVGMMLILDLLAHSRRTLSQLAAALPQYEMRKLKLPGSAPGDYQDRILRVFRTEFRPDRTLTSDGLRLDFSDGWIHVRESNTEPVVRLIAEGREPARIDRWITLVREALGG